MSRVASPDSLRRARYLARTNQRRELDELLERNRAEEAKRAGKPRPIRPRPRHVDSETAVRELRELAMSMRGTRNRELRGAVRRSLGGTREVRLATTDWELREGK